METAEDDVGVDQYWIYTGEEEVPEDVTHVRLADDVTVLPARTFISRGRLMAVELNEGLVVIEDEAFYFCSSLEYVRFPPSVKTVGVKAFNDCSKLSHVEFLEHSIDAIAIGEGAFGLCQSLTEITLPKSLSVLGKSAFQNCTRLTRVELAHTGLVAIQPCVFSIAGRLKLLVCQSQSNVLIARHLSTAGVFRPLSCTKG